MATQRMAPPPLRTAQSANNAPTRQTFHQNGSLANLEKTLSKPQMISGGTSALQFESDGPRQRHQPRVRRDHGYNAPIGGYNSSDDSDDETVTSSRTDDRHHQKRRQIRRRLHHKHRKEVVPVALPWIKWMHSDAKNHTVAFMGEFVGTFMFLFFAFAGTQVANIGAGNSSNQSTTGAATGFNVGTLMYIALSFGFSLMVNAWIFFRISGGLFNPAVTLALWLLGALDALRAVLLFIAQLTGACFASYIVSVLFPTVFNVRTTLAAETSVVQGIFIEAIGTAELVFTIIMLAAEKHRATFIAPVGIGLALFIGELVAVYYTGGSMNPARSFGPAAVAHDFGSDDWIYWVGPLIGTLLAVGFYKLNKVLEYEMANPGQDGDVQNDPTQNENHDLAQVVEERALEVEEIRAIEEQGGFDNVSIVGSLDPSVMEADAVADLDDGGALRPKKSIVADDLEAQWSHRSEAAANSSSLHQRTSNQK